jgi:DNA helicase-2/ATP-dependent DNA helicase PcrA
MGVPYKLIGGTRFYERKEVKDVLAYLRLALNPADTVSLGRVLNVPARGIGDRTVSEIQRWASRHGWSIFDTLQEIAKSDGSEPGSAGSLLQARARNAVRGFVDLVHVLNRGAQELTPLELFDMLLERTGYAAFIRDGTDEGEERWSNITEVRTKAQAFGEIAPPLGLAALLEEVSLVQDVDTYDPDSDGVTLITLHAAKGLEFPYVMIVGMEEGLSPHSRSMDDPAQMEEERRLMYVGVTRAKKGLTLVHAHHRMLYGNSSVNQPSRFLSDIPLELTRPAFPGSVRARASQPAMTPSRGPGSFGRSNQRPQPAPPRTAPGPGPVAAASAPEKPVITEQQYQPGDRVFHPTFGAGIVVTSVLVRGDEEVTVAFEGKGVKKLSVAYAPLQRG